MLDEIFTNIALEGTLEKNRYRTKKINLVLIGGKAGVGKTTAAAYLHKVMSEKFPTLKMAHKAFATPIKTIARNIFGWDGNKDDKGRRLLQVIGTDAGREYNENIWVSYLEDEELSDIVPNYFVFVDDWRFPNEMYYFTKNFMFEVFTVRIERNIEDNSETSKHKSENSLPGTIIEDLTNSVEHTWSDGNMASSIYNFVVFNDKTIEEFYKKLDSIVSYLSEKVITY